MKILVTGGSGLVGKALCARLGPEHSVVALGRSNTPRTPAEWAAAVSGCDAVVNLAGESIAGGRWTDERKKKIRDSRIDVTRGLVGGIAAAAQRPRVLVSTSAIGYYGARGDEVLDETAPPGDDFLARVCVEWEREAQAAAGLGVRVVCLRFGVVLARTGGALERMAAPFKAFLGGPVGSGEQWISWIHLDDLVRLIEHALHEAGVSGAINATAPEPKTNREFSRTLGAALSRPSWAPVPAFVLRLALGEMAEMLLNGQRVVPAAADAHGFQFQYPTLEAALRQIYLE